MRAVCLIVFMAFLLQLTISNCYASTSINTKSTFSPCCKKPTNRLDSNNIESYSRTDDKACKKKAYIVKLKTQGKVICVNATSKDIISAIKTFDSIKKDSKKYN